MMAKDIVTADMNLSVREAAVIMRDREIGSILVTGEEGEIAGILTETELVRNVLAGDGSAGDTIVRDAMNPEVTTIDGDSSIFEARKTMSDAGVKHMIVVAQGKPVGIISSTALLGS